ncbi:MAG: PepSY domain-containing protein, partial [Oscillospiraceae bacterium]|nr:PepSY domain-containing protein [Oscillospiraceae bacterium]
KMKRDIEDGIRCYELKFVVGTVKYSADISAADGTVLSWEVNNIGNSSTSSSEDLIGIETAKEIALERVGLSADDVTFIKEKQKLDDGIQVYEIEFCSGTTEYDIKINASS